MTGATADLAWMARAVALAERARAVAHPNPAVGCVLVRDGVLLAEGCTRAPGDLHAEAAALAGVDDATGATAYVTLEPCAHHGRTPPCADALVEAGIARVVVATVDPNPAAAGGADRLAAAGVDVEVGLLGQWVQRQLAGFVTVVARGRPHVTLKLAQTVDGHLTNPTGRWVTGPASRRSVHRLRARSDAVLVGSGTVLADDPVLDVRDVPAWRGQPRAVVLDARGRTPADARVARPGTLVYTAADDPSWQQGLEARGVAVRHVRVAGDGAGLHIDEVLSDLVAVGVHRVLAEPGATLAGALVRQGSVDRVVRYVATSVRAADGRPRIVACLEETAAWPVVGWTRRGPDVELVTEQA